MASALRTILIISALATPLAAQTTPEDPPPAIVEGSVINIQNSRTIPRATVTLLHLKGTGSKSQRADGRGHFLFTNVEPGIYRLMAERQGFFSDDRKREYQPLFEVAAGEHVKNMPVRLMPAAAVSGEILDEYNDPVQDVEIRLMSVQMRLGQMYLRPAAKAMTDDRGEYRISGLHPGRYYVVAEYKSKALTTLSSIVDNVNALQTTTDKRGHPLQVEMPKVPDPAYTYPPQFYPATGDFRQAQSLKLNPGDQIAADFLLVSAPVVTIRGKVTNGMTGQPPKGASVSAFWTPYMEGDGIPALVSSQDGSFEIRGVAPGIYTVRAGFTEDNQSYAGEQTVEVGDQGAQNVQIAAVQDFVAAGHVTLTGDLQKPGRVLMEFAGEGLTPRIRASANFPEFKFEAQLRPERRYYAVVRNLRDDYYLKSVAIAGHELPPDNVVVSGIRGDMEIVLSPRGAQIEGALLDAKDEPTRGSILLVPDVAQPGPPDLYRRTNADSRGKFTLRGVAPGSYRLVALESVNLDSEINEPDFLSTVGNRGQSLIVEENGKYSVALKLETSESK
ncbi:MAG TPA: carboxypeptidase regulatory-like domain-containing protein [Candidatus Angelobacter sp.]|nr:carboxypeptidase regulatory-like domain-containing protein [Candidatus Angelobacter sp.]